MERPLRRDPGWSRGARAAAPVLPAIALLLVLAAAASLAQPVPAPPAGPSHPGGALFSTIDCARTPLGEAWSRLRPRAEARFPGLRHTLVEDLHVTVVYVGKEWKLADLDRIRPLALAGPREAVALRPEPVRLGRDGQVVAIELHGAPAAWSAAVVAAKAELNRLGLKRPDAYDASFRAHVTLASARRSPPSVAEAAALEELKAWLAGEVARDESAFRVAVGPETPVRLWLAGTARPAGGPEYVDLEEALSPPARPPAPAPRP